MKTFFKTLLILAILGIAGGVAFLYSGLYNVAATAPHSALFHEAVEVLVERSVDRHAGTVQLPEDFYDLEIQPGFEHYDHMCVGCHGAPGVEAMDIARQMNPEPPKLADEAEEWTPAQLYWIITHGLKMTGMPGAQKIADEQERWQLTAFVRRLPRLSAEHYAQLKATAAAHGGHRHGE